MRSTGLALVAMLLIGCASATPAPTSTPQPTPQPTLQPTAAPTPAPTAAATVGRESLPLPAAVSGIPGSDQPTVSLGPETPAGSVPVGEEQVFQLGHCGLGSPIDFDGSLWNPIAGDDGAGGPLTADQIGELINATTVSLLLTEPDVALIRTPLGAIITLERLPGERAYALCM
jgi:hypothetical protein